MKILLARTHGDSVIPMKANKSDFCYDLVAVRRERLAPRVYKYWFGRRMQIVRDAEPIKFAGLDAVQCFDFSNFCGRLSIDFRPRSSVWRLAWFFLTASLQ